MAYEQRDNSGTLGRNDRKEKETHPDHTGSAIIDGKHYWVSAWIKTNAKEGNKFFSLAFKLKDVQPTAVVVPNLNWPDKNRQGSAAEIDSDIPF